MISFGGVRPHATWTPVIANRAWSSIHSINDKRASGSRSYRKRNQKIKCVAALDSNVVEQVGATFPTLAPILLGGGIIGGIFGWRLAVYSQLEYVTASMLTNYVIKGGARVVQIGGGTRELYYYPKGTVQVTFVGDDLNKGLMQQAGISAQIPVVVKDQPPENANMGAGSSADAVVLIGKLSSMKNIDGFLEEICRVLKPGAPLIFIERVAADGVGSIFQGFLGDKSNAIDSAALEKIKSFPGFEEVNWDIALDGQDPHALGVASKSEFPLEVLKKSKKKPDKKKTGFS
ncbi:hypothetical protein BSKO_11696 [Bryopsis sp. KO-2023]|nr:hypothetical protein BSKO_11696 [Bryopsis sp. KO-2023]